MEDKVLAAEVRSERAVRRITAALAFVIAVFMAIILLTTYLKFEPKAPEITTDKETGETIVEEVTESKLKQFLDVYKNKVYIRTVALSFVAGLLCYLPAFLADASTLAAGLNLLYVIYQKSFEHLPKFPNGVLVVAVCFFGASLYCAIKRNQIYNTKKIKIRINSLVPISAAILAFGSLFCRYIASFKTEYETYTRLVDKNAEDYVEKKWGNFEPLVKNIESCIEADYYSIAIVFVFLALIVLVLHNFPRLAALASGVGVFYSLYKITVGNVNVASLAIFFTAIVACACAVSAVSATKTLRKAAEYADGELDEELDEDNEDEAEYLENKKALEDKGLEMEDYCD